MSCVHSAHKKTGLGLTYQRLWLQVLSLDVISQECTKRHPRFFSQKFTKVQKWIPINRNPLALLQIHFTHTTRLQSS